MVLETCLKRVEKYNWVLNSVLLNFSWIDDLDQSSYQVALILSEDSLSFGPGDLSLLDLDERKLSLEWDFVELSGSFAHQNFHVFFPDGDFGKFTLLGQPFSLFFAPTTVNQIDCLDNLNKIRLI